MSLPGFSVRRPVTTIMIYVAVLLLGVIAWKRLPQELYPPISYPQLTVVTHYKDAAPEEMEILVTKPIEEVAGTVSGVRRLSAISKEEVSLVIAEFDWGTNMDFAALGVREKLDLIKEQLPRGAEDPVVIKFNPFELPVLVLNLSGELSPKDLLDIARKQIKIELEKVDGVAAVNIAGGLEREILVEVDQGRLQAAGLPISQVTEAVSKANINYPAGSIKEAFYEYLIRTMGEFQVVQEIPKIAVGVEEQKEKNPTRPEQQQREASQRQEPLKREKGLPPTQRVILLKDVGVVKDTFKEKTSVSRFNGEENVSLRLQKQAGGNTLQVATQAKEAIQKKILPALPPGVHLTVASDQSLFIRNAISGVTHAAIQGAILAFIVLYLFLGNPWAALNVSFAIPISVLATFGLMYFSGTTINIISLGGLALGVGLLVDAGIVVVENIDRYREQEKEAKKAAISGTEEVASAVVGSILTNVVVFLPMVFVAGIVGQLLKDLAYTVTFSNLLSLAVSLTLTALFASWIRQGTGRSPIEPLIDAFRRFDMVLVKWFVSHRFLGISMLLLLFAASVVGFGKLDREVLPKADQGQFTLRIDLEPGTRLEVTDRVSSRVEQVLRAIPEVNNITVTIGSSKEKKAQELLETLSSHQAQIFVTLKPLYRGFGKPAGTEFRTRRSDAIVQELKETLNREPLERAEIEYVLEDTALSSSFLGGAPVIVEVKGLDLTPLEKLAEDVKRTLEKVDGLYGVKTSQIPPSPETKVYVNKDRAAAYHLSVSDIALTAQTAVKGFVATKFKEEGKEIDIRVRLRQQDREDINKVRRLVIHSPLEVDIPLSEVAYLAVGKGPTEIRHLDQQRTILVAARLFNRPLNQVIEEVNLGLKGLAVPNGYSVYLSGENEQMQESFKSLAFALLLSVILVYMVMAAEFESLWQPLLIMLTIPLSLIGVVFGLWITGTPVSVMVAIGFILLGGIVVNNGIVLVEYINLLMKEGMGVEEAVIQASQVRLRPILMTAAAEILGLMPLALGLEEGVELQGPMAITQIWGMLVSTFLTLIFMPTLFVAGASIFLRFKRASVPALEPAPALAGVGVGGVPLSVVLAKEEFPVPMAPEPPPVLSEATAEPLVRPELQQPPREAAPEAPAAPSGVSEPQEQESPDLPDIPEEFGGEDAVHEKPESGFAVPMGWMEKPEPSTPEVPSAPPLGPPSLPSVTFPSLPSITTPSMPSIAPPGWPEVPPPLNPRQQQLLEHLKTHGRITRKEYAELTGASVPTAARDLKELVDRGLIRGIGPLGKGRYYVLAT